MNKITKNKDLLFTEYVVNQKPMHQIAKEYETSTSCICYLLKKYGIPARKYHTAKTKEKISISQKGNQYRKGKKSSEETKQKLRNAKLGKYTKSSKYGGHTKLRTDGYIMVYCPEHPNCTKDGYVMEHILVMENQIGRYLAPNEVVHHINKKRNDNRIENLKLMTFKEHAAFHMRERWNKRKEC